MVAAITTGLGTLGADLLAVGAVGLGIGASTFGLVKGWRYVKKFI